MTEREDPAAPTAAPRPGESHFFRYFFATVAFLLLGIAGTIAMFPDAPAPHVSNEYTFNEKARWLRNNLRDRRCDTVVLGSSMGLNNFDSTAFHPDGTPRKIVNLSSWGLTFTEDLKLLEVVGRLCHPTEVIMPITFLDLTAPEKEIDWPIYEDYVRGGVGILTYARTMDILYYLKSTYHLWSYGREGRQIYESLQFDPNGDALLTCDDFKRDLARWNGYKSLPSAPILPPKVLVKLGEIARAAQRMGARLVVAPSPMRPAASRDFFPEELDRIWQQIGLEIAHQGGSFIRVRTEEGFEDRDFADFNHMTECGAKKWTSLLSDRLASR